MIKKRTLIKLRLEDFGIEFLEYFQVYIFPSTMEIFGSYICCALGVIISKYGELIKEEHMPHLTCMTLCLFGIKIVCFLLNLFSLLFCIFFLSKSKKKRKKKILNKTLIKTVCSIILVSVVC